MTHLTPAELIDALDAALPPARRAHLDTCADCRREAHGLKALLGEVRATEVPEPSPLFWDHLSTRVRAAIADQPARRPTRWFEVPVLAPFAGLAMLVLALLSAMPGALPEPVPVAESTAVQAGDNADGFESQWALLSDLVDEFAVDGVDDSGLPAGPGAADGAVLHLSLDEQRELMRLLREELRAGG